MVGLLDPARRFHEQLIAIQLEVGSQQGCDRFQQGGLTGVVEEETVAGRGVVDLAQVANVASPVFRAGLELDLSGGKVDAPTGDLLGSLPECRHFFVGNQISPQQGNRLLRNGKTCLDVSSIRRRSQGLPPCGGFAAFATGCRIGRPCRVAYIFGLGREVSNVG